jgi:hypothetical protein
MEIIFIVLPFVYSIIVLGMNLHHNHVMFFSCFHNKVSFEYTFFTFYVFVLSFHLLCFICRFRITHVFVMIGSCPLEFLLSW